MDEKIQLVIDNPGRHFSVEEENTNTHSYIIFSDQPRKGANTDAGFLIIDYYLKGKQSRQKWYKDRTTYHFQGIDDGGNTVTSHPINYTIVAKYIREHGCFDRLYFNLLNMECRWMDSSLDFKIKDIRFDDTGKHQISFFDGVAEQQFGKEYPIQPELDREGRSFTTLHPLLLKRIMRLRTALITNSYRALTADWFLDLRTLISDSISLVEITLNQIYIKAEYDPLPEWVFDREKLGDRNGRKFKDKLGWIYQITGKTLDAELYASNCDQLRMLRNHMMHFDPPSFTMTLEEVTEWLNYIIDIGYLLIKMRKALGVEVSLDLVNFILQKEAIFQPEPQYIKRIPLGLVTSGYKSTTWKK